MEGLADEGFDVPEAVVWRVLALRMALYSGLSAYPFEHLGSPPTPELVAQAHERAGIARYALALVAATEPVPRPSAGGG